MSTCEPVGLGSTRISTDYAHKSPRAPVFKRDLALQNTPLSKQPFETQPQIAK